MTDKDKCDAAIALMSLVGGWNNLSSMLIDQGLWNTYKHAVNVRCDKAGRPEWGVDKLIGTETELWSSIWMPALWDTLEGKYDRR